MTLVETMTPRERVMNALAGLPVDRTPVANPTNVATVELMDMVDAPFPDACRDPELGGAAGGYGLYGAGLRRDYAVFHDYSGVGGAGLRDAVGGEGQLADGADGESDMEGR